MQGVGLATGPCIKFMFKIPNFTTIAQKTKPMVPYVAVRGNLNLFQSESATQPSSTADSFGRPHAKDPVVQGEHTSIPKDSSIQLESTASPAHSKAHSDVASTNSQSHSGSASTEVHPHTTAAAASNAPPVQSDSPAIVPPQTDPDPESRHSSAEVWQDATCEMSANESTLGDNHCHGMVHGDTSASSIDVDTSAAETGASLVIDLCEDSDDEIVLGPAQPTDRRVQFATKAPHDAVRPSAVNIGKPGRSGSGRTQSEIGPDQGKFMHDARRSEQQARLESNELGLLSFTGAASGRQSDPGKLASFEITSNDRVVARGPGGTFIKQNDDSTSPISDVLSARAKIDPRLKALLVAVASKTATPDERKLFHQYVEEARVAAKAERTAAARSNSRTQKQRHDLTCSPVRRSDRRLTQIGDESSNAASTQPKRDSTMQVIDLEEDSDDNIEVHQDSGEQKIQKDKCDYSSLRASEIKHYGPVYPSYYSVLARESAPYVHAVCGQNYTTPIPVKKHHKRCGDGRRRWNEHPSCDVGYTDLQIVRCMDGFVITSEQGYQRHEAAIRAGLDFVGKRNKALRLALEASNRVSNTSSTEEQPSSNAELAGSATSDLSEEEVLQESSTGVVDYRHLYASQITHFGPVYYNRWAILSRTDPAPYIHAACGQGYTHPENVRKHSMRSVCSDSRNTAWDAHPSCQIAYSDLNIGRCKDGWILLDQGSHDKLEEAVAAGLQHLRDQLLAAETGGDDSENIQSMVTEVDAAVPATQSTTQTVDYRHLSASQVRHFGPVHAGRWEILRRTDPAPYIHSACGKAYPHPSLVKQHATRHPCSHSAQYLWNQHPSCHIDYSDLKIGQCRDGWVLLDQESHEKVETAIAAGLHHIRERGGDMSDTKVPEPAEEQPEREHTSQTVDYRPQFSSQVPHFGPVYQDRRGILRRANPGPYIHAACGRNYVHPSDVKDHALRKCALSSERPWDEHPSNKAYHSNLNIGRCEDGWVLLDRKSHDEVESAIKAGLQYLRSQSTADSAGAESDDDAPLAKRRRIVESSDDDDMPLLRRRKSERVMDVSDLTTPDRDTNHGLQFVSTSSDHDYTPAIMEMIPKALKNRVETWQGPEAFTGNITKLVARKKLRALHITKNRRFNGEQRVNVEAALIHMVGEQHEHGHKCHLCHKGGGHFMGCVSLPGFYDGACASCICKANGDVESIRCTLKGRVAQGKFH